MTKRAMAAHTHPRIVGPATITPQQRDADEWGETAFREALPRIRTLAGQWGATVTALTGLYGVGSLISTEAAVRALRMDWRIVYGCVALVALAAAGISILTAALASQATVSMADADVNDRITQRTRRIEAALIRLRWSRSLAAAAFFLGAVAISICWYAPH